jgi:hypothetical protein
MGVSERGTWAGLPLAMPLLCLTALKGPYRARVGSLRSQKKITVGVGTRLQGCVPGEAGNSGTARSASERLAPPPGLTLRRM